MKKPVRLSKHAVEPCRERGTEDSFMKISYDQEVDALYIRLVEGHHECHTWRLTEEIALNLGEGELLVGIEVLDAKEVLGAGTLPSVRLENVPLLKAA